jgi:hypothetical protein
MLLERREPIHSAVFFDTGWEFLQTYNHLRKVEEYAKIRIKRIGYHRSFDEMLMRYGWPSISGWWCKAAKRDSLNKYARLVSKQTKSDVIQVVGMAADEPDRCIQNGPYEKRYPLFEWGITEKEALEYCTKLGFNWGGLYDIFPRVSCRLCPERGIGGTRLLRRHYPLIWGEAMYKGRLIDGNNGYVHGKSCDELDARFSEEDRKGWLPGVPTVRGVAA